MLVLMALISGVFATGFFTPSAGAQTIAPWDGNFHPYVVGDLVTFNGSTYKCIQSHTSQPDWSPPVVPALWGLQQGGATATATRSVTNTPTRTPTTGPSPTPSRTPTMGVPATATRAPTPPPVGSRIFAPYLDISPGPNSTLGMLATNSNSVSKMYSMAFILGRGCSASWFGVFDMNSDEANNWVTRINELRGVGGDVIVSFGGAAAPELANVCSDAASLQAQYQAVVSKYNLRFIDLDIEDFDPGAIDRRNQALAGLERANPNLHVHYTLGVLETGMTQAQLDVLSSAKKFGVRVDLVNIMAMDYGHAVSDMLAAAESAAQGSRTQLNNLGFTTTALGITPMIGQNDSAGEIFTLSNASGLVTFARNNGIQLLAFWSVGRDNGGCPGGGSASPSCSGISQSQFQFSSIFRGFLP